VKSFTFLFWFRLIVNMRNVSRPIANRPPFEKFSEGFYKLFAIFLQPSMEVMSLVSTHSLILLVRTETEG
jgi:hypothetical protein